MTKHHTWYEKEQKEATKDFLFNFSLFFLFLNYISLCTAKNWYKYIHMDT